MKVKMFKCRDCETMVQCNINTTWILCPDCREKVIVKAKRKFTAKRKLTGKHVNRMLPCLECGQWDFVSWKANRRVCEVCKPFRHIEATKKSNKKRDLGASGAAKPIERKDPLDAIFPTLKMPDVSSYRIAGQQGG